MSGRKNRMEISLAVDETPGRERVCAVEVATACQRWLEGREPARTRGCAWHFGNRGTKAERTERRRLSTK